MCVLSCHWPWIGPLTGLLLRWAYFGRSICPCWHDAAQGLHLQFSLLLTVTRAQLPSTSTPYPRDCQRFSAVERRSSPIYWEAQTAFSLAGRRGAVGPEPASTQHYPHVPARLWEVLDDDCILSISYFLAFLDFLVCKLPTDIFCPFSDLGFLSFPYWFIGIEQ